MNLNKHLDFFDPNIVKEEVHIIGVGAIGSTIAELLTRLGFKHLHLYDIDTVSDHNITNQMYLTHQIGMSKLDALVEILRSINPEIGLTVHPKGYNALCNINGYVFLAVDSIELRKQIVNDLKFKATVKYVTDCRMSLTDAQCYAADWTDRTAIEALLGSMNFTAEEAKAATPVSACGTTLSVTPTVRVIVSLCVTNLMNFIKTGKYKHIIIADAFAMNIVAFPE